MSQEPAAKSPEPVYPMLRIENGSQAGREVFAGKTVVIGRGEECDLRLIDEQVSRRHAEVNPDSKGGAVLRDLGSVNGTLVDGQRVTTANIPDRGRFKIGSTEIVFLERPENERKTQLADRAAESRSQVECVLPQREADILAGSPSSDEITSVYRLARLLPGSLDPKELPRRWLADVCKELKADSGALMTRRGGEETVIVCPETGPAPRLSRSVMERVLSTGDSLLVADLGESELSGSVSLASSRVATLIAAPVPLSGEERAYV